MMSSWSGSVACMQIDHTNNMSHMDGCCTSPLSSFAETVNLIRYELSVIEPMLSIPADKSQTGKEASVAIGVHILFSINFPRMTLRHQN